MKTIKRLQQDAQGNTRINKPVVVLYNKTETLIRGELRDKVADQGVISCAKAIVQALNTTGHEAIDLPFDKDVESVLAPYKPEDYVVFNLAEGMAGKLFEEARIAWALDAMGHTFTGNSGDAIALTTNKGRLKSLLNAYGLKTPDWILFPSPDEVTPKAADKLRFPLIVKPVAEDGSIGLDTSAIVHSMDSLKERIDYISKTYLQSSIAERFIEGRELNVALMGNPPLVLPIAEIDFSDFSDPYEKIVSFDAKWKEDSFEFNHTPTICPAPLSNAVEKRVKQAALRAWEIVGCSGYARVDMRLDHKNIPYILEVNCNPDISPNAGFHIAARTAGYNYKIMISQILKSARRTSDDYRRASSKTKWRAN